MSTHLNLDSHIIESQTRDTQSSPRGLVVGAVLLQAANHSLHGLLVAGQVVRAEEEDILPATAARELEGPVDVVESLFNLNDNVRIDFIGVTIPAT